MTEEPGTVAGSGWTEQEIIASVDAWVRMHKMQQAGTPFVKEEVVRVLQSNELKDRTRGSVQMRFMNISAVSLALEHEIVQGFQPLGNIGKTNWKRIQSRMEHHGFGIDDIESSIEEEMNILVQSGLEGFEASRMRERAWQQVTQRRGQSRFRTMLLEAYDNKCAVTRINEPMVLEAAHIEPYSGAASNVAHNGLLLKSDIHKLFDRGVLVIQPDLTTMIAPSLQDGPFGIHDGQRIRVPERQAFRPSPILLKKHMVSAMETW
jgi:5-methylcytosine-specific restriction enzyme A